MISSFRLWLTAGAFAALAACGGNNNKGSSDGGNHGVDAAPADTGFPLAAVSGGIAYTASIMIGSNGPFALDVDTGSTTLGVAGSTCVDTASSGNCGVSPEYAPGTTAMDQGTTTTAQYGDNSMWSGENYSDSVEVMGDQAVTMRFAEITSETGFFRPGFTDEGIIGFGPTDLASPGTDSFIAKRAANNFAFQMCPDHGTLWIDQIDTTHAATAIQYTPFLNSPFYELTVNQTQVGSDVGLTGAAVLDTGTSLIVVGNSTELQNIITNVQGAAGFAGVFGTQTLYSSQQGGLCMAPMNNATRAQVDAALPPWEVTFGSQNGTNLTIDIPATQSYLLYQSGDYCFAVEETNLADEGVSMILGDAFLRNFLVVFDLQNKQAGLATQSGCALPDVAEVSAPVPMAHPHWFLHGHPM